MHDHEAVQISVLSTEALTMALRVRLRRLLLSAFEQRFSEEDWRNTLGGLHVLALRGDTLVSHGAVIPRKLYLAGITVNAGYVEGVATEPRHQGAGYGSRVMAQVNRLVRQQYALGALSTSAHNFYERLGWVRWQGPTNVRGPSMELDTRGEDAGVMVLLWGARTKLDLTKALECDDRPGDPW